MQQMDFIEYVLVENINILLFQFAFAFGIHIVYYALRALSP